MFRYRAGIRVQELSPGACREKLESESLGRLGVNVDALPVVLPVNFAVDGNSIVIRTSEGTKLSAAMHEAVVAFEVDHYDPEAESGWSVLVQGRAHEITDYGRIDRAKVLPLRPVTEGGAGDHFIEVEMEIVTGRRVEPADAAASQGA